MYPLKLYLHDKLQKITCYLKKTSVYDIFWNWDLLKMRWVGKKKSEEKTMSWREKIKYLFLEKETEGRDKILEMLAIWVANLKPEYGLGKFWEIKKILKFKKLRNKKDSPWKMGNDRQQFRILTGKISSIYFLFDKQLYSSPLKFLQMNMWDAQKATL